MRYEAKYTSVTAFFAYAADLQFRWRSSRDDSLFSAVHGTTDAFLGVVFPWYRLIESFAGDGATIYTRTGNDRLTRSRLLD